MFQDPRRRVTTLAALLVAVPSVATAQVDPSAITQVSSPVRALASLLLVLVFGSAVRYLYEEFVEDAISSSMDQPLNSFIYGVLALGGVAFLGGYAITQVSRLRVGPLLSLTQIVLGVLVLTLAGLGFTVVGTRITELLDERQLWYGVGIGAVISAVAWLIPSFLLALLIWSIVAAVGVGGPTREWLHATREGDTR
jgi:hypothetical protein